MLTTVERFWLKVDKSGICWEWTAYVRDDGYGQFFLNGKQDYAHRAAYEIEVGQIPEGLQVCHSCDNRKCVRPSHLFIGTQMDNMRDMHSKGRSVNASLSGEKNGRAKLSEQEAEEIRVRCGAGLTHRKAAALYGVGKSQITRIVNYQSWWPSCAA